MATFTERIEAAKRAANPNYVSPPPPPPPKWWIKPLAIVLGILIGQARFALFGFVLMLLYDVIASQLGWRELPFLAAYCLVALLYFLARMLKQASE
jgi:hypothetical protein